MQFIWKCSSRQLRSPRLQGDLTEVLSFICNVRQALGSKGQDVSLLKVMEGPGLQWFGQVFRVSGLRQKPEESWSSWGYVLVHLRQLWPLPGFLQGPRAWWTILISCPTTSSPFQISLLWCLFPKVATLHQSLGFIVGIGSPSLWNSPLPCWFPASAIAISAHWNKETKSRWHLLSQHLILSSLLLLQIGKHIRNTPCYLFGLQKGSKQISCVSALDAAINIWICC